MRLLTVLAAILTLGISAQAAGDGSFLQLRQSTSSGETHIVGKNVSRGSIVAYVVVAERGTHKAVFHGVYTAGDSLHRNNTVDIGRASLGGPPERLYLDFVRLADGTTQGEAATDDAKEIVGRVQK
jgi:hypothetical protein